MFPGSARLKVCACLLLGVAAPAVADGPPTNPAHATAPRRTQVAPAPARPRPAAGPSLYVPLRGDPSRARAEVDGWRRGLPAEKELTAGQAALKEIWTERLSLLDEWDKAARARREAEHPDPDPDREVADRKADLEQKRALIEQLARSPDAVLPEAFLLPPEQVDDVKLAEMSRGIDRAREARDRASTALEEARARPAQQAVAVRDLGLERDKAHARKTTLPSRRAAMEAAYASASTEEARRVARERLVNFNWESAVADERLAVAEASLALESRRAEAIALASRVHEAQLVVARAWLAALSGRYEVVAERKRKELHNAAVEEQARAVTAGDPIERFRARRMAELLGLEARIVEEEKALSATPALSLEGQKEQADHAEADFAGLRQVVQENRVGGLVALRLNNDFRRISRERALIQRNEFAQTAAANAYYENALTEAELNCFNDARDDRFERDAFLESIPRARRDEGAAAIDELEHKQSALLARRKDVLEKLLTRAEKTHEQVGRRLRVLDAQYTFIRTHLFWVRDSEPIGVATPGQARKEAARLASALARLGAEPIEPALWSPVSAEFGLTLAGLVVLPPVILLIRRRLRSLADVACRSAASVHVV